MSKDFLLEIGMEEMPAKFAPGAVTQMENNARKMLQELRLEYKNLKVYVTPRRLCLYVQELAEKQQDIKEEAKGPAKKAAYDADGQPTKAAVGFARGQGVAVEDLYLKEFNGVPYVYALKQLPGEDTEKLLPKFCLDLIASLNFPKPMRWGHYEVRFARPIRWLVALFGDQIIPFSYVGLQSGRTTQGHRTLGGYVRLTKPAEYLEALEAAYVIADQDRRKETIRQQIKALAAKVGGYVDEDEDLLTEVNNLLEYPTALLGEVDVKYMILPEEVITTPMKEHQRYFPVRGEDGKLLPYFVTVRNGDSTSLDLVKEGNKKVLKARLEDAAFYYREDLKKPLPSLVPQLDRVVYHEKLGTVGQRVERLRKLSALIADYLGLKSEQKELVDRTALLAKADLITHMVYDFPELQGIMGAYYAGSNGEPSEVCQGIMEHYMPRFAGDDFPRCFTGKVVSIADKLDAIVGAFGVGIQPTGSQDPYALRRQALGVVGMLMQEEKDLSLHVLIQDSYRIFADQKITLEPLEKIRPALEDFFKQRIRYLLQENGLRYDVLDAVLAQQADRPYSIAGQAKALAACRKEAGFISYLNAYVRCANLSKKASGAPWAPSDLADPTEIELWNKLQQIAPVVKSKTDKLDFLEAYTQAAQLVPDIEKLFEAVMIMVEEESLRAARLGLLQECVKTLGCLGDLTQLA
ncbi:MAG: glycine--tRNA ligase subunit beta [Peptococcaceae bacterium]|nr:glycine--tRNA ligase subunit beta [Peptococcaceae bacterium]